MKIDIPDEDLELKNKCNNVARGKILEGLFSKTLTYLEMNNYIYCRFWDRPQKHVSSNKKLLCDYWYISTQFKMIFVELKMVKSMTSMPLSRLEDHQRENIYNADSNPNGNGWVIIWFKYRKQDGGMFAISGDALHMYINFYEIFKVKYNIKNNKKVRKSISREDLTLAAYNCKKNLYKREIIMLDLFKAVILNRTENIIDIMELGE